MVTVSANLLRSAFFPAAATLLTGFAAGGAASQGPRSGKGVVTSADGVAADMSSAPPEVGLGALQYAMSFDREIPGALQELKLPVVVINSDNRPTDAASLKRYGVKVVIMPGVGHFMMMEDPARFNPLLKTAIDGIGR